MQKQSWVYLGPLFVSIGASLWGLESYFRINLNQYFDSEILVFYEHVLCTLLTLPALIFSWRSLRPVSLRSWMYILASGAIGSAIGTFFFTLSLRMLNPSVASVLLNFQPIVSVACATLFLRESIGRTFILWASVALGCGLIIALNDFTGSAQDLNMGLVYVTLTALLWGFSTVAGRGAMLEMPLAMATTVRFVAGTLTLFISLQLKGKWTPELLQWELLPSTGREFFYMSFATGVVPSYFYLKGLQKTSASVGAFCELFQTVAALILTWGVLGHALSPMQVAAALGLVVAVYQINSAHSRANVEVNPQPQPT